MVSIPKVSAPSGNIAQAGVNPVPSQTGQAVGRGLQQVGNQLNQFANEVHATHLKADRLKARQAEQKFLTAAEKELSELDPLAEGYSEQAELVINNARDQALEETEFRTNDGRANFQAKLEAQGEVLARQTFRQRNAALEDQALRNLNEDRQQLLADIADDPANAQLYQDEFNARIAETYAGVVPQSQLEEAALRTAEAAILAEAQGLAEAGDHKGARAVLDENRGDLAPEQFRAGKRAIRSIQNQQRADFARATASEVADLQIMVNRADTPEKVAAAREAIRKADERGVFNGRQSSRARLTIGLDRQLEAAKEEQAIRDETTNRMAAGAPARTQKEADRMWREYLEGATEEGQPPDPQVVIDSLDHFVRQHGRVPSAVKQQIAVGERTNDPAQLANAAVMAMTVENAQGNADVFDLADDSPVARVMAQVENRGVSVSDAARNVLAATDQDNVRKKRLGEQFDDEIGADFDADVAGEILTMGGVRGVDAGPAAVEAVRKAYRAQYIANGGDKEEAKKAAAAWARNRFGVTNVGGQPQLVDRQEQGPAPEAYIPPTSGLNPRQRAELIERDVRRDLAEGGLELPEDAAITLRPDRQTQQERRAGETPSFPVLLDGNPVVIEDEDGRRRPMRYTPPTDVEDDPFFQQLIREAEERARREDPVQQRQDRRQPPQPEPEPVEPEPRQEPEPEPQPQEPQEPEPEPEEPQQPTGAAGRRARRRN